MRSSPKSQFKKRRKNQLMEKMKRKSNLLRKKRMVQRRRCSRRKIISGQSLTESQRTFLSSIKVRRELMHSVTSSRPRHTEPTRQTRCHKP